MKFQKCIAGMLICLVLTGAASAVSEVPADPGRDPKDRWESLSDQEKQQIYDIMEHRAETEFELLKRYVQLGLINEEQARELRQHIEKRLDETKKKGLFPGAGMGPREEGRKKAV